MKKVVRIEHICIENFKNVNHGKLDLVNKRKDYKASILGLYGQNGSGKTTLIDSLQILKYVLSGQEVPDKYADYINVGARESKLRFRIRLETNNKVYIVHYSFSLCRKIENGDIDLSEKANADKKYNIEICKELLEYSCESEDGKSRKLSIINTGGRDIVSPKARYKEIFDGADSTELIVLKRLSRMQSKGFIFCREMMKLYRKHCSNSHYMAILEGLADYGHNGLFIINTANTGWISMNALPLAFKYKYSVGNLMFSLNEPTIVLEEDMALVEKVISNMNIVLKQIVPTLTIGIRDLGATMAKNGKLAKQIQLISFKNNKEIALRYESDGIKKLVSILQLLIVVYNNASVTVAIDELDAGVFEYLLGELLKIISEKGRGQLIFTSHNLRPLETIDKGFIAFTTTNPNNRYIRMTRGKERNLRDFYYRDIVLGERAEEVYSTTDNFEIALAFREAGEAFGS